MLSGKFYLMSKFYPKREVHNIPAQNIFKESVPVHRVLLRKLHHARAGNTEEPDRRNGYAQNSRNHSMCHSCFLHYLSPCLSVWDMLNVTKGVGIRREEEQLTSEMRFCIQAFAFSVHTHQLPKLCVDLK